MCGRAQPFNLLVLGWCMHFVFVKVKVLAGCLSKECFGNAGQLFSQFAEIVVIHTQNNCLTSHSEALSFLGIFIIE